MDLSNNKITILRRIIQITAFIIINYIIIEAIFSINMKAFDNYMRVLPVLNSPRNPLSEGAGFVEYIFYFMAEGEFPLFIIAIFILIILFTNRFFCGWICPIGTIQDCLTSLPVKKKRVNIDTHETLTKTKYLIIILLLIIIVPLGVTKTTNLAFHNNYKKNLGPWADQPVGFFSLSEYIFVFFSNLMGKIGENWGDATKWPIFQDFWIFFFFMFYLVVIIGAIFYPRLYCRYLCPYGAIAAALSDYSFLKLSHLILWPLSQSQPPCLRIKLVPR